MLLIENHLVCYIGLFLARSPSLLHDSSLLRMHDRTMHTVGSIERSPCNDAPFPIAWVCWGLAAED
jgi:hypothetical protein